MSAAFFERPMLNSPYERPTHVPMIRTLTRLVLLALLPAACASPPPPVPATYTGPVARIQDSIIGGGMHHVHVFYLAEIDGRPVAHSGTEVTDIKPMAYPSPLFPLGLWRPEMGLSVTGRLVPAQQAMFRIAARTNYTTPLSNMLSFNAVSGEIAFTPQADELYSVRGVIGDSYSAVWIADSTGTPVGPKIERGQKPQ